MIHIKIKQLASLVFCLLFLSSCATSRLLSTWEDDSSKEYMLADVLVVGVAKDETKRRIYEDTFTDSLVEAKVSAMASYTFSKQSIEASEKALREVVQKSSAKAVLVTHLVSADEKDYYQPNGVVIGTNSYNRGLYGYYPYIHGSVYNSGSYVSTTKVILETSIYDVQSEKRIWSARSESIDPVMTRKYYQQLIDLFLDDLKGKNII